MKVLLPLVLLIPVLVGCSNDGQMTKTDEATVKNNFTRSLSPDEVKQMGGSKDKTRAPNDKL